MKTWCSNLRSQLTPGAQVETDSGGITRLSIPKGPGGCYRLAQLDDYHRLARKDFPHKPPFQLELCGRVSAPSLPGTWGFGLWNDPFGMGILSGEKGIRLPTWPEAAWFFFASPENYLSFRDDLPAHGGLAAVFRSSPSILPQLAAPFALLLIAPPVARLARRWVRRYIRQAAIQLDINPMDWHDYRLEWESDRVCFQIDGHIVFETDLSPRPPLGVVIWIDNQYAAYPPTGRIRYGMLPNPHPAWLEIKETK